MRKQNAAFKCAFTSEAGKNLKNTDSFGYVELDQYACYVIADGIEDNLDAMSAKLAVDTIVSAFMEAPSLSKRTLKRCLITANRALCQAKSKMKLKASVTVVVTDYVKMRYGQAGNTRLRLYRDGFLKVQSKDNSFSRDLVDKQQLEPDRLARHEERNNLYCYLGQEKDFHPFVSNKIKLSNTDALALFTRGIWEHIDDGELTDAFGDATDEPQPTVDAVEDLLLSGQPKDLEKYTFAVIFFNKIFVDPNFKRKVKRIVTTVVIVLVICAVALVIFYFVNRNRQKNIEGMEQSFYNTVEYIQGDNYPRAKEECQKTIELAKKVRNKEVQEDASNYIKLIESVIAADSKLDGGAYEDAQRIYQNAQTRSRYADNLGMDYIEERLEQTSAYLSVYDMISLGDTLALQKQYEKAEEQYRAAKELSGKLYFDKGRTDAISALEALYAAQEEEQTKQKADTEQAAEEQSAAAGVLSAGDAAFAKGEYESAKAFYITALQKYTELKDQAQIDVLSAKLAATDKELAELQTLRTEAENYMRQGESAYNEKNYIQANKYYLLAKDVYAGMKDDAKVAEVTRRLELVGMGISEEEKAAREAKEAEEKAEREAKEAEEKAAKEAEKKQKEEQEENTSTGEQQMPNHTEAVPDAA